MCVFPRSVREVYEVRVGFRAPSDELTDLLHGLLYVNGVSRREKHLGFSLFAGHERTLQREVG